MFANWVTDPEATRFWGREPHKDISVTKALLRQWFAEYEQEMAVYFSISKEEVTEIYIGDTSVHEDLFKPLEEGYEIAAITMDGHFNVWDELDRDGLDTLLHREGFEDYLIYCKERNITAASITASIGWSVGDLLDEVKLQKQDYMNHVSQADRKRTR